MIPERLVKLVEKQPGDIHRSSPNLVNYALGELGVPIDSELGEFFRKYAITFFQSEISDEQLCDLLEPTPEVGAGTKFIQEVWGLPEQYICLSSIQGEGAYLYNRTSGEVLDFELKARDRFMLGQPSSRWSGFFEFMTWYLG